MQIYISVSSLFAEDRPEFGLVHPDRHYIVYDKTLIGGPYRNRTVADERHASFVHVSGLDPMKTDVVTGKELLARFPDQCKTARQAFGSRE